MRTDWPLLHGQQMKRVCVIAVADTLHCMFASGIQLQTSLLAFFVCIHLLEHSVTLSAASRVELTTQEDLRIYKEERYLELYAGQTLELNCTFIGGVEWILPTGQDVDGFDAEEVKDRLRITSYHATRALTLENVKQSDTGEYICKAAHFTGDSSSVYVFVRGNKEDDKSVFLKKDIFIQDTLKDPQVVIPCKANRMIERGVQLSIDNRRVRNAEYDPRQGFFVSKSAFTGKSVSRAVCEYKGDRSIIVVLIVRRNTTDISISVENEWPYVGQPDAYSMNCSLRSDQSHVYVLSWECPLCDTDTDRISVKALSPASSKDRVKALIIDPLIMEDSGIYKCKAKSVDSGRILEDTYELNVSPRREQIRVVSTSEETTFNAGDNILFFHFAKSFPSHEAQWTKIAKTFGSQRDDALVITQGVSSSVNDGVHEDRLNIENASVDDSGLYQLAIALSDKYTYYKNWTVKVKPQGAVQPHLTVSSNAFPDSENALLLNEPFTVTCISKDVEKRNLLLFMRSDDSSEWNSLLDVQHMSEYTVESVVQWKGTAHEQMQFKCEDAVNGESAEINVTVTDVSSIEVAYNTIKVDPSYLEPNEVYEGDHVELICRLPQNQEFAVSWYHNGVELNAPEKSQTHFHQEFISKVKDITKSSAGSYECIATPSDQRPSRSGSVEIQVLEVVAPHIDERLQVDEREASYGERAEIICPIVGSPRPMYKWLKNGNVYDAHDSRTNKLRFPRVMVEDKAIYTCVGMNRAGSQEVSIMLKVTNVPAYIRSTKHWWALGIVSTMVLILLIVAVGFLLKQWRKTKRQDQQLQALYNQLMSQSTIRYTTEPIDPKHPLHERIEELPYDRNFEINKDKLTFKQLLGGGQFGQVYFGELRKTRVSDRSAAEEVIPVAIKAPRDGRNVNHQKALADELKVMIAIGVHANVLCLIGAVTKEMSQGHLYVVVECCDNGNLKEFLSRNSGGFLDEVEIVAEQSDADGYLSPTGAVPPPTQKYKAEIEPFWAEQVDDERQRNKMITTSDLVSFGFQIANGMEYLANRTCIHRDLAARNILVTKRRAVRIADFGLARRSESIYHIRNSQNVPLPFKWMALESILNHDFTERSDVWAYGILLWEIFSLGRVPYPQISNDDLIAYLQSGNRMEQPKFAPDDIYNLMRQCWLSDPNNRPNFSECKLTMKDHLSRASPPLYERLNMMLKEDLEEMERYSEWRGVEEGDDLRTQMTRNGFIAVPTQEPNNGNLYLPFNELPR